MLGKNEFKRVLERGRRRRRSRSCGQNADRNVDKTQTHDICLCLVQHAGVVMERQKKKSILPPNSDVNRATSVS